MNRLRRRLVGLGLALGLTLLPTAGSAATILVFGQAGGGGFFSGDQTGGTTVLDATNVPIVITTLNEAASSLDAFFHLDAVSTAPAQQVPGTNAWRQFYDGAFQVTSLPNGGGVNYLSGTFLGIQLGVVGGNSLVLGAAQPPLALTFTTSVPGMPLDEPRGMALALTNVLPSIAIVDGTFADFTANVAGDFSAEVIPEPATLALLAAGLVLTVGCGRRPRA